MVAPKNKDKKEKPFVATSDEICKKIKSLISIKEDLKQKASEANDLGGEIKEVVYKMWKASFLKNMKCINWKIGSKQAAMQFVVASKFPELTEDQYEANSKVLGDKTDVFIETKDLYSFDPEVLQRNMEEVSAAIMRSRKIPKKDKDLLIVRSTLRIWKKDSLDNFHLLSKKQAPVILDALSPQIQLRNSAK